jgi:hypothetical protein
MPLQPWPDTPFGLAIGGCHVEVIHTRRQGTIESRGRRRFIDHTHASGTEDDHTAQVLGAS